MRRCYEAGHRPKFLVVVDNTEECDRAVYFAGRRAKRVGASVVILSIATPADFQNWFSIGEVMREEAEGEARALLAKAAVRARELTGAEPEAVVRIGSRAEVVRTLIGEDEDISLLVLASGANGEGPGPLVSAFAGKLLADLPVPVVIVPGHLTDAEINALA